MEKGLMGRRAGLRIVHADAAEMGAWDAFVGSHPLAGPFHHAAWYQVLETCFSVEPWFFVARDEQDAVVGVLPAYRSGSLLAGHHVTTLEGGALADDPCVSSQLYAEAMSSAARSRAAYFLVRAGMADLPDGAMRRPVAYCAVDLAPGDGCVSDRWSPRTRKRIDKARQSGVVVRREDDTLSAFYAVFAERQHALGTPVFGPDTFNVLRRELGASFALYVAERQGEFLGGILTVRNRSSWTALFGAVRTPATRMHANYALYAHVTAAAREAGVATLDLGRSVPGSGAHRFKQKWATREETVEYSVCSLSRRRGFVTFNTGRPAGALAHWVWRHIPLAAANRMGPVLRRRMPLG